MWRLQDGPGVWILVYLERYSAWARNRNVGEEIPFIDVVLWDCVSRNEVMAHEDLDPHWVGNKNVYIFILKEL